ncbi:hypothetical protein GOBAR_AA15417 [Gossypium barbadense]|uniref:AP2/ERF domain-containing protein n=2 Tax=Gossypium barbadense TaxID=3634 RepID=A0A2P5XPJ7_GOSBA|nr:hypothetical protein GOBAR_AA15417 [Gossypium barbadense]
MEIQSQQQSQLKLQPKPSNPSVSKGSKFKGRNNNKVNKFVGVRQRPSGRWVAEIKNTTHKIRMWLGTFETAEEAARAYDEAACLLHGSNTRTNFITQAPSDSPLACRIRNLLNSKKGGEQHHHQSVVVSAAPSTSGRVQDTQLFDDAYKPDMRSWRRESGFDSDFTYTSSELGFDRFLSTQETTGLPEETGSELTEFQSMKVERQISASLHAMNGVEEYMETVHDSSENLWDLPPLCSLLY